MEEYSAKDRALAIAQAYRDASDMDTRIALNAQARTTGKEADGSIVSVPHEESGRIVNLQYFLISAPWLRRAWKLVLKPPTCMLPDCLDRVGRIDNAALYETETTESSAQQQQQSTGASSSSSTTTTPKLRPGLQHEHDYYLVGNNAWLLLSQKFGTTHTCPAVVRFHTTGDESKLAVDPYSSNLGSNQQLLRPGTVLVPLPGSGRFPYERSSLDMEDTTNFDDNNNNAAAPPAGYQALETTNTRQPVSDDESEMNSNVAMKDASSDGVPDDDEIGTLPLGGAANTTKKVVLLPPSTTEQGPEGLFASNTTAAPENDDFGFANDDGGNNVDDDDYWKMDTDKVVSSTVPTYHTITKFERFKYGSGLGNLGNTCFMNSTLQCLGHTHALQKYFISGEFERDLNRDNPLGTGGELATAFAKLLTEMWTDKSSRSVSSLYADDDDDANNNQVQWTSTTTHTVYPRDFKFSLGKHAEQFMGYDQHDSQEFATYLLDALHEDTNRVTKKPYIEKPEQEEGETDEEAAEKAWQLNLRREDSRVMEEFMGQIKSRVQCCEPGCGRVSTTFDPFLYLSVPIPGSSERRLAVIFVPLDPAKRMLKLTITIPKLATMPELLKRTRAELVKCGVVQSESDIAVEDLIATDIWQKEVYNWIPSTDSIDRIRDSDETFIYQVRSSTEIREISQKKMDEGGDEDSEIYNLQGAHTKRYMLDVGTVTLLNKDWTAEYAKYLQNHLSFLNAFNPSKGTTEDRVRFYRRTVSFLDLCHKKFEGLEDVDASQVSEDTIQELVDWCATNPLLENVKSTHDLAVLEFCAGKMRKEILDFIKEKKSESSGGVTIQVRFRTEGGNHGFSTARTSNSFGPIVLRIPNSMSVYELRAEIAAHIERGVHRIRGDRESQQLSSGQSTSEEEASQGMSFNDHSFGSPAEILMRQTPMTYDRKSPTYSHKTYDNSQVLGSLEKSRFNDSNRPTSLADPKDPEERRTVASTVGEHGSVNVEVSPEQLESSLNPDELMAIDEPGSTEEEEASSSKKCDTVLDCIDKYCQMEQLEETEMWYCNRCKKHVRAWKQFHLYRTPPYLIIHLKRFQYSATTHRRDKISQFIDFPLEGLDLTRHVMHKKEGQEPIYDCYAVSNHYGGLGGGHYTAHAVNDDGSWCYYDDSRITTNVDPQEAVSDAAYVLYYRRRDLKVDEDFLLKIPTPEPAGGYVLGRAPAVVSDIPNAKGPPSELSGSNAAIVDDDNMDVEETLSNNTSLISDNPADDYAQEDQHTYGEDLPGDDESGMPRQ